ncbi:porin [Candidatus Pelagibacter sp.]|nr:porin [Candidatus Pelagibacter sp.]
MNKYKKIGLTALAGSLVAGSVSAAEMSASGSATMTFTGGDEKANHGNGWTMADSVTFTASGDVNDIGVTLKLEIDGDAQSKKTNSGTSYSSTTGSNVLDSHSISFDFGEAGSLTFAGHGGDGFMSANDDVMPTASEEPWDVITGADGLVINGFSGDNMFTYKYSHDSGLNLTVGYINAGTVTAVSYTDYGITYTGIDGLTLGYGEGDVESTAGTKTNESTMFAKYTIGSATVGMQISENNKDSASDAETTGFGVSYQVNDDLAVSFGTNTAETVGSTDQEATAIGVSYTMGSLGIALSMNQVDNIGHTGSNDREGYQLGLSFAF